MCIHPKSFLRKLNFLAESLDFLKEILESRGLGRVSYSVFVSISYYFFSAGVGVGGDSASGVGPLFCFLGGGPFWFWVSGFLAKSAS